MNVALRPPWTIEQFFAWAELQDQRYEFDGSQPVAMTGGSGTHTRITLNIHTALRPRLRGTWCSHFGPDLGVRTIGQTVRYPDALVTCSSFDEGERLAPGALVIFEVISPTSGRMDRIIKVREYAAVPSLRRYVLVESAVAGLQVLHRENGKDPWIITPMTLDDTLGLPEIGADIPVTEFYEDVQFADPETSPA